MEKTLRLRKTTIIKIKENDFSTLKKDIIFHAPFPHALSHRMKNHSQV